MQLMMADNSMVMSQDDISALKETLHAQQNLLQKLYNELDQEREASATAASEALSVILRLQGEKSAVKMEAEHYKRLAEEKMCHAEESFAIIEDIIDQKEMEVAALDYQVQAYRYKLMSMGVVDPGSGEIKFPENLLQRNENLAGDTSFQSIARRNSAPIPLKYRKALAENESSTSPENDLMPKTVEEQADQEINELGSDSGKKADSSTHGGMISYGEQIRKLDIRVKEIAGANYVSSRNETRSSSPLYSRPSAGNLSYMSIAANLRQETRSPSPQLSISSQYDPNKAAIVNDFDQAKHQANSPRKGEVLDVFEVPQVDESCRSYESSTKDKRKKACQAGEILESKGFVHPEPVKLYAKDEPDWLKKLLHSTHHEKSLCKPSDIAAIDRALLQPSTSVAETRPPLRRTSGIGEIERLAESTNREEELKLLKEIKEQLNLLQHEIRCQKAQKSPRSEMSSSLHPLPEVLIITSFLQMPSIINRIIFCYFHLQLHYYRCYGTSSILL